MLLYTCIHGGNYKLGSVFGHVCVLHRVRNRLSGYSDIRKNLSVNSNLALLGKID